MQESDFVPKGILQEAEEATLQLLPAKSREHYEKVFSEFNEWKENGRYKTKKAAVLERAHVEEFLTRACDKEYLMIKVAQIMEMFGACRCCGLTNLKISDLEDRGAYLLYSIPDTKIGVSRKFTIMEEGY